MSFLWTEFLIIYFLKISSRHHTIANLAATNNIELFNKFLSFLLWHLQGCKYPEAGRILLTNALNFEIGYSRGQVQQMQTAGLVILSKNRYCAFNIARAAADSEFSWEKATEYPCSLDSLCSVMSEVHDESGYMSLKLHHFQGVIFLKVSSCIWWLIFLFEVFRGIMLMYYAAHHATFGQLLTAGCHTAVYYQRI